jgi:hypothetical protein
LEKVAAPAALADRHARLSTVPVDDIERVQQQLAAFVSSGQLPELSLAEIPDLGFAIDDSTFAGDALQALSTVTEELDAEPQMAHLSPSLSSLVGGGGGGFGGGGGGAGAGVAGHATTDSVSEGRDGGSERSIQSVHERGENGGGRAENGGSSSGSSNGNGGSASNNGSNGSASNGSTGNGSTGNGSTGRNGGATDTPRGAGPGGGVSAGRIGGGTSGNDTYQVPEPSSMLLIGLGLAGAVATRRRQRAN